MHLKERILDQLKLFKKDLKSEETLTIVQKYICHGSSILLTDPQYFALKNKVSKMFDIHPTDVFMVGSAKLGFSLKNSRRFKSFEDGSDIDLAIISSSLFEQIWQEVYNYQKEAGWWPEAKSFKNYLFKGWIRPDFLPSGNSFNTTQKWWDFFMELTETGEFGPFQINAGIYHSLFFFESYQGICIDQCKNIVES